jgi:purine-binding chemotaxis protein CheW
MERSRPHADAEATLAQRARDLAKARARSAPDEILTTVVLVRLDTERLGLPAEHMQGVYENVAVTELMGTPPWIAGVAQVRGELMSVVHLSHWLGQSSTSAHPVIAVVVAPRGPIGFLVDEVLDSRDVLQGDVSRLLTQQAQRDHRPIRAVTNDLVAILDIDRLLLHPDLIVGQHRPGGH